MSIEILSVTGKHEKVYCCIKSIGGFGYGQSQCNHGIYAGYGVAVTAITYLLRKWKMRETAAGCEAETVNNIHNEKLKFAMRSLSFFGGECITF